MAEKRPLRVGVWCAVSSTGQATDDKVSLPSQEQMGKEFAASLEGTVCAVYVVPGHTRDITFYEDAARQMEAYRKLRDDVLAKRLDVLHAVDPDRLGRDPALVQTVISMCEKNNCEVYFSSSPHVVGKKGHGARYVEAFMSVRASEMQSIRVERHERGIRGRIRRGLASSHWPYGYKPIRNERGRVTGAELDEPAASAVRHVTKLFLEGHSYAAIAERMNTTPYRPPRRDDWDAGVVYRIMRNSAYGGYPHWGGTVPAEASGRYPPLWDEDMLRAVRQERASRHYCKSRPMQGTPLLGVAFCNRCGGTMSRIANDYYVYLRCSTHATKSKTGVACHPNLIHHDLAMEMVQEILEMVLDDPARLELALQAGAGPRRSLDERLQQLEQQAATVEEQRKRIALALAAGTMDAGMYRQTDDALVEQLAALHAARLDVEQERATTLSAAERRRLFEELRGKVQQLLEMEPRQVSARLQRLGLRIWCEDGQVVRWQV